MALQITWLPWFAQVLAAAMEEAWLWAVSGSWHHKPCKVDGHESGSEKSKSKESKESKKSEKSEKSKSKESEKSEKSESGKGEPEKGPLRSSAPGFKSHCRTVALSRFALGRGKASSVDDVSAPSEPRAPGGCKPSELQAEGRARELWLGVLSFSPKAQTGSEESQAKAKKASPAQA